MTPPPPYSASPLPSFCTVPARPQPSLPQALREIVTWWRGRRPSFAERIREEKMVERLAAELADEAAKQSDKAGS
jgi:ribosomal protein S7